MRKNEILWQYRKEFISRLKEQGIRDSDIARILRISRQRLFQIIKTSLDKTETKKHNKKKEKGK